MYLSILFASAVMAQDGLNHKSAVVYKCKSDIGVIFSDKPCADNAKSVRMDGRSPYEKNARQEEWKPFGLGKLETANSCIDAWRPSLKDPESGRLVNDNPTLLVVTDGKRKVLVFEGRAKNGFGALSVQYFLCDLDEEGNILGGGNPYGDLITKTAEVQEHSLPYAFPGIRYAP